MSPRTERLIVFTNNDPRISDLTEAIDLPQSFSTRMDKLPYARICEYHTPFFRYKLDKDSISRCRKGVASNPLLRPDVSRVPFLIYRLEWQGQDRDMHVTFTANS